MPVDLNEAYRYCEGVVGEQAKNFKYSFVFLPAEKKRAISALYAFCRACDDVADGETTVGDKVRALAEIRRNLVSPDAPGPLWAALRDSIRRFSIPIRTFEYILEGVEQDLTVTRYQVFGELREYCFRVASAVGLACLEIFEYSDPAATDCGIDLGIAMQLTNIIRDVGEDAARGRIYLPLEELRRFGVSEESILRGVPSPGFEALMKFQADRARDYFGRARPLARYLPKHSRSCPMVLSAVYERLLDEIEMSGFDVLARRIRVSTPGKLVLLAKTLVRSWL
jgi:phytoene synthase